MSTAAIQTLGAMLTVPQFANELGVKESTVRAWVLHRKISYAKVGGRAVRIPRTELERLIRDNFVPAREAK